MQKERESFHITVALMLLRNNEILLMRRCNTGYMDGMYGFVGGHLEQNESLAGATVRETYEELGIVVDVKDLEFVCAIRRGDNSNYFNYFFTTKKYIGIPLIKEQNKCDELLWANINELPENIITAEKRAIYNYLNKIYLDEYSFDTNVLKLK